MKRKTIIIVLIIGASLLIIGSVLSILPKNDSSEGNGSKNSTTQKETIKNTSEKLKADHCLAQVCITNVEIINDRSDMKVINGTLTNTFTEKAPASCLKLVFDIKGRTITKNFCYLELEPKQSVPLELQHHEKDIITAKDYKIEPLTEEEIAKDLS